MEGKRFTNNIINPYAKEMDSKRIKNQETTIKNYINQRNYLIKLLEQYKNATTTGNIDLNSPEFIIDFNNWIRRNKVVGNIAFIDFLENSGIYIDRSTCAEIGKGYHDSLALSYETTIITPYPEKMQDRKDGKTIHSEFDIENGVPLIYEENIVPQRIIKPEQIDTFLIHNPYNRSNINLLADIHHNDKYNGVIFGVYGKKYDKDMDSKITDLIKLRSLFEDDYIYEDCSYGDTYCHILATNTYKRKIRALQKKQTDK